MQNIQIDLQKNRVIITPDPNEEFTLSSIPKAIKDAGFEPDDMYILARGSVKKEENQWVFQVENWSSPLLLQGNDWEEETTKIKATVQFQNDPPLLEKRK